VPPAGNDTSRLAQMMRSEAIVFTLRQDGSSLTGTVEGAGRSFSGGSDVPAPIAEGKVDVDRVSFKLGNGMYSGIVKDDRIELERAMEPRPEISTEPKDGLAVGPPPDGTDPSRDPTSHMPRSISIVLHRVQR
jgi:beta-galactosidase